MWRSGCYRPSLQGGGSHRRGWPGRERIATALGKDSNANCKALSQRRAPGIPRLRFFRINALLPSHPLPFPPFLRPAEGQQRKRLGLSRPAEGEIESKADGNFYREEPRALRIAGLCEKLKAQSRNRETEKSRWRNSRGKHSLRIPRAGRRALAEENQATWKWRKQRPERRLSDIRIFRSLALSSDRRLIRERFRSRCLAGYEPSARTFRPTGRVRDIIRSSLLFRQDKLNYSCLITSELGAFRRSLAGASSWTRWKYDQNLFRVRRSARVKRREREREKPRRSLAARGDGKGAWKDHWACPDRSSRKPAALIKQRGQRCCTGRDKDTTFPLRAPLKPISRDYNRELHCPGWHRRLAASRVFRSPSLVAAFASSGSMDELVRTVQSAIVWNSVSRNDTMMRMARMHWQESFRGKQKCQKCQR